jgi:hypothetical protein
MSRRSHTATAFQIGDRVRIVGPAEPVDRTCYEGRTGTVTDLWEFLREYIVVLDGDRAPVIFPEASLAPANQTAGA